MRLLGTALFALGLLLAVRVMFFGVRMPASGRHSRLRASRLAVAAILSATGALTYAWGRLGREVTIAWLAGVVATALLAGFGAWWVVRVSALAGADDPEDDPRYRFQGYIGRVVRTIHGHNGAGRIELVVDGQRLELAARWLPDHAAGASDGAVDSEVVIEHVEGDVAWVEPWAVVEGRL